ncbi:glycerate 3-kinase [Salvia divinorum]|uniref:Glycerate 3-kinase n=1 Tax=Salvia divinorum TaxID=28513 RepID=A0ABD1H4W5_SALDI
MNIPPQKSQFCIPPAFAELDNNGVLTVLPTSSSSRPIFCDFSKNASTNRCYRRKKNASEWTPLPTISVVSNRITVAAKSRLRLMQSSKFSGRRCSWIRDTSSFHGKIAGQERKEGMSLTALPTTTAQVSAVEDFYEYICSGPLLDRVSLSLDKVAESIDNSKFKDEDDIPPLVIGFSAPQGCGKTTLVLALDFLFQVTGRRTATISIDDFYLTADGQAKLRESNPGNALLGFRGNAGSHDLPLSVETLASLQKLTREGTKMKLPRYDKSAYKGRGDRAEPSTWPEAEGPLTAILFEGWMLGFKPVTAEVVKAVDPCILSC